MTRAEMKRAKKEEIKKAKVFMLTQEQIDTIKKEATNEACAAAFAMMLGLPLMVLHDKYEWGAKKRLPEFMDHMLELRDCVNEGRITFADINKAVYEFSGVKLEGTINGQTLDFTKG